MRRPSVPRWTPTVRGKCAVLAATAAFVLPSEALTQDKTYPLESTANLKLHNVEAEAVTHEGKRGVRLTVAEEGPLAKLAVIEGTDFSNGVIEAEIAGEPAPGAPAAARGFVGIAFRVQPDMKTYDAFYLRPLNGRADDQVRRNHSVQYISHPDWTWYRMREETPDRYETYVDLVPGDWTRIRIEVQGDRARLFVHGQEQPTLIVNDVKTGTEGRGAIALWIEMGTVAHFRDVRVSP